MHGGHFDDKGEEVVDEGVHEPREGGREGGREGWPSKKSETLQQERSCII